MCKALLSAALLATLLIGAWLRWTIVGALPLWAPFPFVRHAHSHLGYFGLLFPLAWLGWKAAGAAVPGRSALGGYALSTVVTCAAFVHSGYGPVAIVGSTIVAGFWLYSAGALLQRLKRSADPLAMVPLGVVASLACVPPIALNLRSNPSVAHGYLSTFLSALLFVVIVPSALAGRQLSLRPWPLFLLAGGLGALSLGVAPHPAARVGLLAYAGWMIVPVRSHQLAMHARTAWALVALGLAAMAIGLLPNTRPVALGAIHFLILGPVLSTLAPLWLRRAPAAWAWWCGHLSWGAMSGALVVQAFEPAPWTWWVAALGGTATLGWWVVVLLLQWWPPDRSVRTKHQPFRSQPKLSGTSSG